MCGDAGPLRGLSAFSRSRLCPRLCPDPHPHPVIPSPPQPLLVRHSGPLSTSTFWFSCPQQKLTFFGSTLSTEGLVPEGETLPIPGAHRPGVVTEAGLILFGNDDRMVTLLLWVPCPCCRLRATHACAGARAPQGGSRLFWRKQGKRRPQAPGGKTLDCWVGLLLPCPGKAGPGLFLPRCPHPSWVPWVGVRVGEALSGEPGTGVRVPKARSLDLCASVSFSLNKEATPGT